MITRLQLGLVLWFFALSAGHAVLLQLSAPAARLALPLAWPAETALTRDAARKTVIAFVHPRCPCASGTVSRLAEVLSLAGLKARGHIVLASPEGSPRSEVEAQARHVPGVRVRLDEGNVEARRFGVTCGQVLVWSPGGHLLYAGGARGDLAKALGVGRQSDVPTGYRLACR